MKQIQHSRLPKSGLSAEPLIGAPITPVILTGRIRGGGRRVPAAAMLFGVLAWFGGESVRATTYYWDTTTTGLWSDGVNWSDTGTTGGVTGVVPLSADSVFFNQSSVNGAAIIQLSSDTLIGAMTFNNTGTTSIVADSATTRLLTLSGGLTVSAGAGGVAIGDASNPVAIRAERPMVKSSTRRSAGAMTGIVAG